MHLAVHAEDAVASHRDRAVVPLLLAVGAAVRLAEACADHEVTDFRGHLIEAFTLRGRATKLGYTRGSTEDGGWFYAYQKRFPTLGMSSVIQFSGNFLPEENRTVALTALSFERHGHDGTSTSTMRLDDVPPVLLSEAYNDMRLLAGEGSGHDPEWEKKVEY